MQVRLPKITGHLDDIVTVELSGSASCTKPSQLKPHFATYGLEQSKLLVPSTGLLQITGKVGLRLTGLMQGPSLIEE